MSGIKYWLWLSSQELSPRARTAVVEHYGDPERAFLAAEGDFSTVTGISKNECRILESRDMSRVDSIMELCHMQNVDIITLEDSDYPERLKNIYAPPVVLYVKGSIKALDDEAAVAVIGTRSATPYGIKMGRQLARDITSQGGAVISMLTEGVDNAAAVGALLGGGRCFGVLGSPIPEELSELQKDVAAAGALISEYPPRAETRRYNFRDRNRIAAGLSMAVAVVEAPARSGTLLFANEALEQGKEIFAVPGNADAPNSVGTNQMLKHGARPAICGWDILEELTGLFPNKLKPVETEAEPEVQAPMPEKKRRSSEKAKNSQPDKKEIDKENSKAYIDFQEKISTLSQEQQCIIKAIESGKEHIDDIIEATEYSTAKVLSQLTVLEIKGYISRGAGKRISINTK